jgi:hypothetical protein
MVGLIALCMAMGALAVVLFVARRLHAGRSTRTGRPPHLALTARTGNRDARVHHVTPSGLR